MQFCAHVICYFRLKDEPNETYLVHENVYFVYAVDAHSGWSEAERIGKESEDLSPDGHLELNEKKAEYIYAGVRKLIEILHDGRDSASGLHGLELTYSVFESDSLAEIEALVAGDMVELLYRE